MTDKYWMILKTDHVERRPYHLIIGDAILDVDEIRTYVFQRSLQLAIENCADLNAGDCVMLMHMHRDMPWINELAQCLMSRVCCCYLTGGEKPCATPVPPIDPATLSDLMG